MSVASAVDVRSLAQKAKTASAALARTDGHTRNAALRAIAAEVRKQTPAILAANAKDLEAGRTNNLAQPLLERLKLDESRIDKIARAIEEIASQPDPIGTTLDGYTRPNGLRIEKRRVPLGVVLFFYESRPNVTTDAAALALKSGNAVILRGGKESIHSNTALVTAIHTALASSTIPKEAITFIETTDRAIVPDLLSLSDLIDVVIPRGGHSLITTVVEHSTIPVLKHFDGNCHLYVDQSATAIADDVVKVCVNAKTSYPGGAVCNAVEKILFHDQAAPMLLRRVATALRAKGVEVKGDDGAREHVADLSPTTDADWPEEYLAFKVALKVVPSIDEAIAHINRYGSRHTDGILATDSRAIDRFITDVDTASVMINASTRFADGGEYGLGAELGISTDKLHARGPMGAAELTTYKWIVTGQGHIR